jgi:hypothetical protein
MPLTIVTTGNTILASDINQIVNAFNTLTGDLGTVVLNGSTAGTATLYQSLQGTIKLAILQLVGFRNGNVGAQTIVLPVAFTTSLHGWNSAMSNAAPQLLKAGVAQTVQEFLSATAGAAGAVSGQTTLLNNWLWHCDSGFDTISFPGSQASITNGQLIMIGI